MQQTQCVWQVQRKQHTHKHNVTHTAARNPPSQRLCSAAAHGHSPEALKACFPRAHMCPAMCRSSHRTLTPCTSVCTCYANCKCPHVCVTRCKLCSPCWLVNQHLLHIPNRTGSWSPWVELQNWQTRKPESHSSTMTYPDPVLMPARRCAEQ